MSENSVNAFQMAQQQFDQVADMLKLDKSVREFLRWPMREFHFKIPVRMDNGEVRMFQGYRVQHNDADRIRAACASTQPRPSTRCVPWRCG